MSILELIIKSNFALGTFLNIVFLGLQAWKMYRVKSSKGVSLITYLGFAYINLSVVLYAWDLQSSLMMFGYIFSLLVNLIIVSFILYYRKNN